MRTTWRGAIEWKKSAHMLLHLSADRQTSVLRPWMKTTRGSRASLEELDGFTRMAPKSKPAEKKETVRGDKLTERGLVVF